MKPFAVLLVAWGLAGFGAVAGSILGNAGGKTGLFVGAIMGGVLGVLLAAWILVKLAWLPRTDRTGALVGGIVGFGIAAPIAVANLHTPITPILICALAGVGMLLGAGVGRGMR